MPHRISRGFATVGICCAAAVVIAAFPVATASADVVDSAVTSVDDDSDAVSSAVVPDLIGLGAGLVWPLLRLPPKIAARIIVPPDQYDSFDNIITRESGWNTFAINPASGAYGLGQALPPQKMATHGLDWPVNPVTQIRWAYDYMNQRYGSPNGAWAFWQAHGWY
ncbi:transglycosylase SLT domain-containing protein [Nocardia terpenica]|uniref:aggregation-promoting factor C-terminal-like domain-containing protein n=1 Tax=Nocardia terpenica TaxID=455432 RepID=UPI001892DB11|nr:transglycosylase SLT domain-containing protein [Nocardia terpenica]MBF6063661.1 transglycosylase SLT domain-containing protein [Nocardia terpenica]MBF6107037.1 transglycosylase SLT domain-containing protein [Nocardia terpenica]MBF6114210.1 transglycosylase SLT domain-containing protein [Nocardia terpenica]MBF6121703.1 transglycosylase SLT domain-containing protein [Nocardia terpenica]MBF6154118.1 transglycosylase SLT domain-containing protein [Nocardia terpenica]